MAVFVVVSLAVFSIGSLLDQRSARARLLRDRLASVQKAAERQPSEELALIRDEMLSEIPALDSLLRRSARITNLQTLLSGGPEDSRGHHSDAVCAQRCGAGASCIDPKSISTVCLAGNYCWRLVTVFVCFLPAHPAISEIRGVVPRGHRYVGPCGARRACLHHRA